jgi:hypothetical protein
MRDLPSRQILYSSQTMLPEAEANSSGFDKNLNFRFCFSRKLDQPEANQLI